MKSPNRTGYFQGWWVRFLAFKTLERHLSRCEAVCDRRPATVFAHVQPSSSCTQGIDFDRAGGMMTGALERLDGLVRGRGGQGHLCQVVIFAILLMLTVWWLLGKR